MPETPEERLASEAEWKNQVANEDLKYKTTHTKREFTFTAKEARQILKAVVGHAFAKEIALSISNVEKSMQLLIDDMINNDVLPRLGINPAPERHLIYEPTLGRFVIWELKGQKKVDKGT